MPPKRRPFGSSTSSTGSASRIGFRTIPTERKPKRGRIVHGTEGLDDLDAKAVDDKNKKQRLEVGGGGDGQQQQAHLPVPASAKVVEQIFTTFEAGGNRSTPQHTAEELYGSWDEWRYVKRQLTGPSAAADPQAMADVARIISSWRQRAFVRRPKIGHQLQQQGRRGLSFVGGCLLPPYIEATYLLVMAQRTDCEYLRQRASPSSVVAYETGGGSLCTTSLSNRTPQGGLAPLDLHVSTAAEEEGNDDSLEETIKWKRATALSLSNFLTHDTVVNQYCLAISRAVQELTRGIDDSSHETYRDKAKELGMPEEVVEIRNEVAHGTVLPTLTQLRWVTSLAMDWLHEQYWILQERNIPKQQTQKAKGRKESTGGGTAGALIAAEGLSGSSPTGVSLKAEQEVKAMLINTAASHGQTSSTSTTTTGAGTESVAVAGKPLLSLDQLKARLVSERKKNEDGGTATDPAPTASSPGKPDSSGSTRVGCAEQQGWRPVTPNSPWQILS